MSKLGIRHEPGGALFPSPRHLIWNLLVLNHVWTRNIISSRHPIC